METIVEEAREIKVFDNVDVLVCGGGSSGIFAALASARHGADTFLVEQQGFFGGSTTAYLVNPVPEMMGKGGRIINIASVASGGVGIGSSNIAHYTTSKGGSVALTEAMAVELAPKGINVNAIAPGLIGTDMTKFITENKEQLEGMLARVPKGRVGKPEDIGAAAAFLASDEADYVTGVVLYVDGGWLAS